VRLRGGSIDFSLTIRVGSETTSPSTTARDLGVYIDSDLSMRSHVQWTVAGCFAALWQIRSVRRSMPPTTLETLVVSLVLTWLDYGNATLAGIPLNLLRRLKAVQNASARTITGLTCLAHITTSLAALHWLLAADCIKFKLATLTYCCLHCASPRYLSAQLTHVTDIPSRRRLRSSATDALLACPTQLITVSDHAFSVAAAILWNKLPGQVAASIFLIAVHRQLTTCLFRVSYADSYSIICTARQLAIGVLASTSSSAMPHTFVLCYTQQHTLICIPYHI